MSSMRYNSGDREHERPPKSRADEATFKPWRVFVNHIDSFHGRKLADSLPQRAYVDPRGARANEREEDERPAGTDEGEEKDDASEDEKPYRKASLEKEDHSATRKYEVIGTTFDHEYRCPEDVSMIIRDTEDREALSNELINCGLVIYDITENQQQVGEARWALKAIVRALAKMEEEAPKAFKRNEEVRYFILISTVMTWALSKPLSADDPSLPLTEADYRKRKPHPNFKEHVQCEKEVVAVKKLQNLTEKLRTLVICCGITYGDEEGPLHYLFEMAWKNAPFLPIIGKGDNKIPLLHVRDLTTTVFAVLQNWPELRYILAVEEDVPTQSAIVKKISKALTTGKVKKIAKAEAFLLAEVTQSTYDAMTMDLNVDPDYVVDRVDWHLGMPFLESIAAIVREYKTSRDLRPVRTVVLGPPASGKTMIGQYLARHYGVHYVHVKSLITETIQKLSNEIMSADVQEKAPDNAYEDKEDEETDEYAEDDETVNVEELKEELDEIRRNLDRNNGRLDDALLNRLLLRRLRSKECQNQGYVLDGYPKTLEQAVALFGAENLREEKEEEDFYEEAELSYDSIMPELVVVLEASDAFLIERIINRPEREIQHTHYEEEHMVRRLKEYRERNTDENTPLQFFDEMEIHPFVIPIEDDGCPDMFSTVYQCLERLGKPRNYGLSPEEAKEAQRYAEAEARAAEAAERQRKEREALEMKRKREEKMMEWTNLMEALKQEEEERLCVLGLPLRHYLVKYILPTLTQGLIEVAKLRPEDPVDFLAEYLFKENPEGKIFEPDYTETMAKLLNTIEEAQDEIFQQGELDDELKTFLKTEEKVSEEDRMGEVTVDVCSSVKVTPLASSSALYDAAETFENEDLSSRSANEEEGA